MGRLAIVSSTTVTSPAAGDANYAAVKAAAETWVRSVAAGFAAGAAQPGSASDGGGENTSAAVVLVVKALVDDGMRARSPERRFPGFTDVAVLGRAVTDLFGTQAAGINGARLLLDTISQQKDN